MTGEDEGQRHLRWNASAHGWIAQLDDLSIYVSEQAYEEQVRAFFASQGRERKTYTDIMRPAEAAWREQGEIERAFQQNVHYWLNCHVRGVTVSKRGETDEERWKRVVEQRQREAGHKHE